VNHEGNQQMARILTEAGRFAAPPPPDAVFSDGDDDDDDDGSDY